MLCYINKKDINRLMIDYPILLEFNDSFVLHETEDRIYVPRLFKLKFNAPYIHLRYDNEFEPKKIDIESNITLKPEQQELINTLTQYQSDHNRINGIVKARPGFGKTVCAAYLTAQTKLKTLIVLDNSKLVEQWKESYIKFTTLTEEDIGLIVGKTFEDKPVTITMVQTLLSKTKSDIEGFYFKMREAGFGLVLYDEMHKSSSTTQFAKSTLFIQSSNLVGLTATPYGDFIHKFFMETVFGDQLCDFSNYEVKPIFKFIKYRSELEVRHRAKVQYNTDYIRKLGTYNKYIVTSKKYTNIITKLTKNLLNDKHKIMIVVSTIAQLKAVRETLTLHGIESRPLYRKEQYIDKENDSVIVAVYRFASHGFDNDELSGLILATPIRGKTSLVQTIGRVLRLKYKDRIPKIYDLIDLDMGDLFVDSISAKKSILNNEFKIDNFEEISMSA